MRPKSEIRRLHLQNAHHIVKDEALQLHDKVIDLESQIEQLKQKMERMVPVSSLTAQVDLNIKLQAENARLSARVEFLCNAIKKMEQS